MLDSTLNVALGSDGSLSSDNQDLFEAMRLAALVSRADPLSEPTRWLDAAEVFERATVAGAQAIGWDQQIGLIEPGRRADLVLLRADSMFLKPRNNLLNALVFAETGAAVDTVFVDGRMVVLGGQVTGVDEPRIRDRAQESVERLAHSNRQLLADATELGPYVLSHCRALGAEDDPTVTA
jgi:5-methylthioadenosine/S-adenosylhomocysteine deaminase